MHAIAAQVVSVCRSGLGVGFGLGLATRTVSGTAQAGSVERPRLFWRRSFIRSRFRCCCPRRAPTHSCPRRLPAGCFGWCRIRGPVHSNRRATPKACGRGLVERYGVIAGRRADATPDVEIDVVAEEPHRPRRTCTAIRRLGCRLRAAIVSSWLACPGDAVDAGRIGSTSGVHDCSVRSGSDEFGREQRFEMCRRRPTSRSREGRPLCLGRFPRWPACCWFHR